MERKEEGWLENYLCMQLDPFQFSGIFWEKLVSLLQSTDSLIVDRLVQGYLEGL
jgi:hypothetical protein